MSTLFRFIPRVGASIDPRLDRLIAEPEVTVGRAPDAGLQLKRAGLLYHHAVIREDGQYLSIEALAGGTLNKDGAATQRVTLRPGDSVRIGAYLFNLLEADPMGLENSAGLCARPLPAESPVPA
jgi:pSer/pThr/pTyr-binding forkhead associated (FHA) protein